MVGLRRFRVSDARPVSLNPVFLVIFKFHHRKILIDLVRLHTPILIYTSYCISVIEFVFVLPSVISVLIHFTPLIFFTTFETYMNPINSKTDIEPNSVRHPTSLTVFASISYQIVNLFSYSVDADACFCYFFILTHQTNSLSQIGPNIHCSPKRNRVTKVEVASLSGV